MFSTHDTIVAIATPPGRGGIGVVRLSGSQAVGVISRIIERRQPLVPRHATLTRIVPSARANDRDGLMAIDEVIVTVFRGPKSYTGEDVVEISAHGSPLLLRAIVRAAIVAGARLAEPGEFTLRSFLSGRTDLVRAEAIGDLIDAVTPVQARAAFDQLEGTLTDRIREIDAEVFDLITRLEASLDFPEEGYRFISGDEAESRLEATRTGLEVLLADGRRGRAIREGYRVVVVGRPNVGKSSIFNYLHGSSRAIVSAEPGTTRDLLSEVVDVGELPVTLVDTAGIRSSSDPVESEGVRRAKLASGVADLVVLVLDRSTPLTAEDRTLVAETWSSPRVVAVTKVDLLAAWEMRDLEELDGSGGDVVPISSVTGQGMDDLVAVLTSRVLSVEPVRETPMVTNLRHSVLLERCHEAVTRARAGVAARVSEEFVLADLQEARGALEEITGRRTPEDVLARIFERFCVGK